MPFSYAVAVSYVLVDTADKGVKAYQLTRLELGANASLHPEVDTPRCVLSLHKLPTPVWIFWAHCLLALCRLVISAGLWYEKSPIIELKHTWSRLEKLLAAERAFDTVVWQLLASVICPGYTIHTVVALAHIALLPLEVSRAPTVSLLTPGMITITS